MSTILIGRDVRASVDDVARADVAAVLNQTVAMQYRRVKELASAVALLDENVSTTAWRRMVARGLARQWALHAYGDTIKSRARVTRHDVAVVLAAFGATPLTIDQHARAIATMIRADFTDGR